MMCVDKFFFFFSSRRRHTRYWRDWSSDVCSSDLSTNAFRSFTSSIILPSDDSEVSIIPEYKNDATILIVIDGEETQMKNVSLIKTRESQKNIKQIGRAHV